MKNKCRTLCILMASVTLLAMTGCGSSKEISNFYEQSNKPWMKEHKLSDSEVIHDYMDEKVQMLHERAVTILENAQVIRNEEEKIRMNNGEPLRPRVRVNYVVGQLDTFYDTYSVKRLSAYYVTEEKRVVLFY